MATETTPSAVPAEVTQTIDSLSTQVDSVKRELLQAQEVWQTTLADEKKHYEDLLERKELASREQESQWTRQTMAYEERLAQAIAEFEARIAQTEQNAARALAELDDAWQRDKLGWGTPSQSTWPAEREALDAKIHELEEKLARLEQTQAVPAVSGIIEFEAKPTIVRAVEADADAQLHQCVLALETQIGLLYELIKPPSSDGAESGLAHS